MTLEKAIVASSVASASASSATATVDLNHLLLSPIGASGTTLQTLLTTGLATLSSSESSSSSLRSLASWLEAHNPLRPRIEELSVADSLVLTATPTSAAVPRSPATPPPHSAQRASDTLPRVTFLLGGRKTGTHELASEMEQRLGYKKISVSSILAVNARAKKLMEEGKVVEASVVLPILLAEIRKFPEISDFVISGFPRSVKQLQFFQKEFPCLSRLIYLEYSKSDLLEIALRFDSRLDRLSMENAADSLFTHEQVAVFNCLPVRRIPLSFNPVLTDFRRAIVDTAWQAIGPIVKPKAALVFGVPGAGISTFAGLLASSGGAQDGAELVEAHGDTDVADLLSKAQQTRKNKLVITGYPVTESQFHTLGKVFEVTSVYYLEPATVAALEQCKTRWLAKGASRTEQEFHEKIYGYKQLVKKFKAMSFLQEIKFPADLQSVDPIFSLATNLMKPSSLFICGVPFSGRSALAAAVAGETGYPVIDFDSLTNKTAQGVADRAAITRHSGSVIIAGAPCSVEFFQQLYGSGDAAGLLPAPFAVVALDKTHRPAEESLVKAQEYAEAHETEFDAEKFNEELENVHGQLEKLVITLGEGVRVIRNSTETNFLLPRVTLLVAGDQDEKAIADELVNKAQTSVGIVDGGNFPLHGIGRALREKLKKISLNGNRRIPMAMLGGRLVLINTLNRLTEAKFPTVMDTLDSLRGHCQIDKVVIVGNLWLEAEIRRLGLGDDKIVRVPDASHLPTL